MREKETLYIVFDQLPLKSSGGLVMSYVNFVKAFKDVFDIRFVSIFNHEPSDIEEFKDIDIIDLSKFAIDNRFYRLLEYLRKGEILLFVKAVCSLFFFFMYIPVARNKTKKIFANKKVVVSCPAAAIFMSKKTSFILEVHTKYDYFWGSNLLGRAQSALMADPLVTVFRSKCDARRAKSKFNSDYVYSYFDDSALSVPVYEPEKRKYRVLFMGRLSAEKNPFFLLDCAEAIKHRINTFCLDIFGDGELKESLAKEIKKRNMEKYVTLKGYISDKSVFSNYSLLWLPSKNEGLPLVIIEAMANKVPVVTTHWGDAAFEIVEDGVTGFVVDDIDEFIQASMKVLTDEESARYLSENAFQLYKEKFTLQSYKAKWMDILDVVFSENL